MAGQLGSRPRTVITYGTFDLFHVGHLKLLQRLRSLGDRLIVGVSTDAFNAVKGKRTVVPFEDRLSIVRSVRHVDLAVGEHHWDQKLEDIREHSVAVLGMGADWEGLFDHLRAHCEVVYLPRTAGISSTQLKRTLSSLDAPHVAELKRALDLVADIVGRLE